MSAEAPSIPDLNISVKNLSKNFDRKKIFRDISLELYNSQSIAITGRNGSGKSTLIKTIANLLSPSSGEIKISVDNKPVNRNEFYKYIGFIAPYLSMYEEFTARENLDIIGKIRTTKCLNTNDVLKRVGLFERRNDVVKIFSSGMKQRMKIASAILHNPPILLLDEPTTNLDKEGIEVVTEIVNDYRKNRIFIIATNDSYEKSLCTCELNINSLS